MVIEERLDALNELKELKLGLNQLEVWKNSLY